MLDVHLSEEDRMKIVTERNIQKWSEKKDNMEDRYLLQHRRNSYETAEGYGKHFRRRNEITLISSSICLHSGSLFFRE